MNMWWKPENFDIKRQHLKTRNRVIKSVRAYFDAKDFDEVQTPILQIMPTPDTHIHAFQTQMLDHGLKPLKTMGLHTSPEIAMKKLLVAGMSKIYQICPVFRNAEDSTRHSAEFTMLEWYRANTDYRAMMDDCEHMIKSIGIPEFRYKDMACDVTGTWQKTSVHEAFKTYTDINLNELLGDIPMFKSAARAIGVRTIESDAWDDIFHAIMGEKIEPFLGQGAPVILYDYPLSMAALARKSKNDSRYAERFELYICGLELANAFSELNDEAEQRKRLLADMALKKTLYGTDATIDEDFLTALECGMPEASGCALGLDRLVMLASGADDITDVLWAGKP